MTRVRLKRAEAASLNITVALDLISGQAYTAYGNLQSIIFIIGKLK